MNNTETRTTEKEEQPGNRTFAGCCGPAMADWEEMMGRCPMANLKKGSWAGFYGVLTAAGLTFLIALAGWALGVLAFFRTL